MKHMSTFMTCLATLMAVFILYIIIQTALTHRRRLRYLPSEFQSIIQDNQQFLTFPLHDAKTNKVVGTAYTRASMYPRTDGSGSIDVLQEITCKLDDGMASIRLFFNNPSSSASVISKPSVYETSISNGTGKYISNKGRVELTVNADGSRDVFIKCLPW